MSRLFALVFALVGGLFVYLALLKGGLSIMQLDESAYYLTVAFVAAVNAILCGAADFVAE